MRNLKNVQQQNNDSLAKIAQKEFNSTNNWYKSFLTQYIDTTASPVIALFALSYSQEIAMDTVKTLISALTKKFPKNTSVAEVAKQFDQYTLPKINRKPQGQPGQVTEGQTGS